MKKPYWKRLLITARELALSWRVTLRSSAHAFFMAFAEFFGATLGLALALVVPFTFWLAPLWLWEFERRNANEKAKRDLEEATRAH